MEHWLVSVYCGSNQEESTWSVIREEILGTQRPLGQAFRFNVPNHFKVGSLDNLVSLADEIGKLDHHLEGTIKKIERQYSDIEPNSKLKIENPNPGVQETLAPEIYLANFKWNNSKYPPTKSLAELSSLIEERLRTMDEDVKNKAAKFQESRNVVSAFSKKESGNLITKDLTEVLTSKVCSQNDFVFTENLKTLCVILPRKDTNKWLETYEFLDEGVVPRSTKQFQVEDKDNLTIWRVVLLAASTDSFTAACKSNKWVVREYCLDPEYISNQQESKEKAKQSYQHQHNLLSRSCKVSFSELYIALVHLKAMRVFVESVLRYSLPPQFYCACITPEQGREKKVIDTMIKRFINPGENPEMYGTREETEDGEDFFPFVFLRVPQFN